MHTRHTADHNAVLDDCMTRQHGGVAHDNVVAEHTVMRHMGIRHQQAVVANARLLALTRRAVYGRALADCRAVADERIALLALKLQILRHLTDGCALENLTVAPDLRPFLNHGVWADLRPLADLDMIRDDRIRADLHVAGDARRRCDHRRIVDIGKNLARACHLFQLLQPHRNRGRHIPLSITIRQKGKTFTWQNQPLSPDFAFYRELCPFILSL